MDLLLALQSNMFEAKFDKASTLKRIVDALAFLNGA